jgi:hypothetical protein
LLSLSRVAPNRGRGTNSSLRGTSRAAVGGVGHTGEADFGCCGAGAGGQRRECPRRIGSEDVGGRYPASCDSGARVWAGREARDALARRRRA